MDGVLREVVDSDLDAFFEHQREPEANRMAAFPARDREAFDEHQGRPYVHRFQAESRTHVLATNEIELKLTGGSLPVLR